MNLSATKATRISVFDFTTPQMRTFHMAWSAFFLCFVGWFAIAPLTSVIKKDLNLTPDQLANSMIASVSFTIIARLLIGVICDKWGPRKTYSWLMIIGAFPVMLAGLSWNYESFFVARLLIGGIGASFVVTQFHTTQMFATNTVGTANATAAGMGNTGAGAANAIMPVILTGVLALGVGEHYGWRLALIVPGVAMFISGLAYWRFTQDTPRGDFAELRAAGETVSGGKGSVKGGFWIACADYRVWILALVYAACFGIEIHVHNSAASFFEKHFKLDLGTAGLIAGMFGAMAFFARGLGGYVSDRVARKWGLFGRKLVLGFLLVGQGLAMLLFARSEMLGAAIASLCTFALFVHMAAGGTYAVIPFVNRKVLGSVAGIVGAGGNVGAMLAGFLSKNQSLSYQQCIFWLSLTVLVSGGAAFCMRFSPAERTLADQEMADGRRIEALAGASVAEPALATGE